MIEIDWGKYQELNKKTKEEMTEEEWDFYKEMYRLEEFQAGLDGEVQDE